MLVPAPKERKLQFIDVRDLSAWIIRLVEQGAAGTIHESGSDYTMVEVVEACKSISRNPSSDTWVSEDFLVANHVGEWVELPLWILSDSLVGLLALNNARAFEKGLTTRPLIETVRDTLAWDLERSSEVERKAGLSPSREIELLHKWQGFND